MIQDRQGRTWAGTRSGGVSCYDGQVFQTLTVQDGLASNETGAIFEDREGDLWFGTSGGVTRYRPPALSSPPVFIDAVVADRRYEHMTDVEVPVGARLIAFEFHGISFKTRPEAMVYRYRLVGHDDAWQNSHARRVEYQDLPLGAYRFQVQAVDRDLAYSELAEVRLAVIPDPRIAALSEVLQVGGSQGDFVGKSPYLQLLLAQVQEVAHTELTALVQGETGTGKGLVARAIHTLSGRKGGPFVQVNCGALADGLVLK
ncbi:MAG: sigma 54-interacting transcriptional regulator [Candidatus Latescibacteria bacterium]|nr:sigma 54-interacting transcriptional regulator [Candidatus Latescibacterota bacterium]